MTHQNRINARTLYASLSTTVYMGARASRLLRFTPDIIDMLYPGELHPDLTDYQRAFRVEQDIRGAVDALGGNAGHALSAILCLDAGLLGRTLNDRRRIAGQQFSVEPDTFSRDHEKTLLYDLAIEICRIHDGQDSHASG